MPGGPHVPTQVKGSGSRSDPGALPGKAELLLPISTLVLASKPGLVSYSPGRVPRAARTAYLLGIASEHRVDQLDPMGQAGGNHVAGAVGRPDPLVQVACSELLKPMRAARQPGSQIRLRDAFTTTLGGANPAGSPSRFAHL